jgi:hypothetical protein
VKTPASGALSDAATQGQQKVEFEQLSGVVRQGLGGAAEATYTLDASDSIKPIVAVFSVDTAGGAASDNLARIQGEDVATTAGMPDGAVVILRCTSATRKVTVKHAAGGTFDLRLHGSSDWLLDNTEKWLCLERRGTVWYEVFRAYGGDKAAERTFLGLGLAATLANPANPGDDGKAIIAQGGVLTLGTPTSSGGPLHRLRVDRVTDQTLGVADGSTWYLAQFPVIGVETSSGNLWDAGTNEIKIPSGVSYIRVTANLEIGWSAASPGLWWAEMFLFRKSSGGGYPSNPDGHNIAGLLSASFQNGSTNFNSAPLNAQSGEIAVSAGDRMKLMVRGSASGGGNVKVLGLSKPAYCWLGVEFFA